jgi:hypothetical protein
MDKNDIPNNKVLVLCHKGVVAGTGVYRAETDEAVFTLSNGQMVVVSAEDIHSMDPEYDTMYPNSNYAVEMDPSVDLDSIINDAERNPLAKQIGGSHYKECKIQPIEFIEANNLGFLEGCVVKRITRHNKDSGKGRQDIEKAIHELQLILALRYDAEDEYEA